MTQENKPCEHEGLSSDSQKPGVLFFNFFKSGSPACTYKASTGELNAGGSQRVGDQLVFRISELHVL